MIELVVATEPAEVFLWVKEGGNSDWFSLQRAGFHGWYCPIFQMKRNPRYVVVPPSSTKRRLSGLTPIMT